MVSGRKGVIETRPPHHPFPHIYIETPTNLVGGLGAEGNEVPHHVRVLAVRRGVALLFFLGGGRLCVYMCVAGGVEFKWYDNPTRIIGPNHMKYGGVIRKLACLGVDEGGEEDGVPDEEDGRVVPHQVPVPCSVWCVCASQAKRDVGGVDRTCLCYIT